MRNNAQVRFGGTIVRLRNDRGWTQEDLSHKTDITVKHISSLENGHREPCLNTMMKLAKAFGISISELMKDL